jgi:hypothetical protein
MNDLVSNKQPSKCSFIDSNLEQRLVEDPSSLNIVNPPVHMANGNTEYANKRRRLSPSSLDSSDLSSRSSKITSYTPPSSAPPETKCLRITIPRQEPTLDERRKLAIRRAAAKRWEEKLERPFPKGKEIRDAYELKLMRHYKRAPGTSEPNFTKPTIDVSPRVVGLLQSFPKMVTSPSDLQNQDSSIVAEAQLVESARLKANQDITKSESARQLAWQSFSSTETDRVNREREAMMESGLIVDDLIKESHGYKNGLPEWKKWRTGKFVAENWT